MHRLQKINIEQRHATCKNCGNSILELNHFRYAGKTVTAPRYFEELCVCSECGANFLIHYDIFDSYGHINPRTFSGDVNNPEYNWQDSLTEEQKGLIAEHLKACPVCCDRLSEETLEDAWFAGIIHQRITANPREEGI